MSVNHFSETLLSQKAPDRPHTGTAVRNKHKTIKHNTLNIQSILRCMTRIARFPLNNRNLFACFCNFFIKKSGFFIKKSPFPCVKSVFTQGKRPFTSSFGRFFPVKRFFLASFPKKADNKSIFPDNIRCFTCNFSNFFIKKCSFFIKKFRKRWGKKRILSSFFQMVKHKHRKGKRFAAPAEFLRAACPDKDLTSSHKTLFRPPIAVREQEKKHLSIDILRVYNSNQTQ